MNLSTRDSKYRARILVVDDEVDVRLLLSREIRDHGHEVVVAANSTQAMEEIRRANFDVVLTDIRMPGMDGMGLTEWIKRTRPETDVILMTGYASVESAAAAVRLNAFDYLLKPFGEMEVITSSIDRAYRKQRLNADLRSGVEELRASQLSLRNVIDKNNDGIVVLDKNRIVRLANPAVASLLNREVDTLMGSSLGLPVVPGGTTEHAIIESNGERRIIEAHVVETEWEGETAYIALLRNSTERKKAEDSLRQHSERLKALHEIDLAILAVQSPVQIARVATHHLRRLLSYWKAAVIGFDMERGTAEIIAVDEESETALKNGTRLPLRSVPGSEVLRRGTVEISQDMSTLSHWTEVTRTLYAEGMRSYVTLPLIAQGELIGCLMIASDRPKAFSGDQITVAREVADSLAVAIQNARLFDQVQAARQQIQLISHRLVEAQEIERNSIARELHDEIGQVLTGLKMTLETSIRLPVDEFRERLSQAQGLLNELMRRVRELSLGLRPAMLDDFGLLPTLLWLHERFTTQTHINIKFKHAGVDGRRFSREVETAAYRIIQEALTNVARHAAATQAKVRLWVDKDSLNLRVEDRGTGFNSKATIDVSRGSGLVGMRERTASLNGRLTIESQPGAGTVLIASLPVK